jgi:cold shock CspA family protein
MQTQLLKDETLLLRTQRHWALLATWAWKPAAMLLATILLNVTLSFWLDLFATYLAGPTGWPDPRQSPVLPDLRLAVTLLLLAVAGFWFISLWLRWSAMIITVTDYRVIRDTGTWPHNSHVIGLDRILDVSTYQTPTGKMLDYGTVKINGQDLGFDFIPMPERFAEEIFVHVTNMRKGGAKPEPGEEELLEMESASEQGLPPPEA